MFLLLTNLFKELKILEIMKIISWNVNGIRAILKKEFLSFFYENEADIYCLQETKMHNEDIPLEVYEIGKEKGYKTYWNGAKKRGYSGTGIISKEEPLSLSFEIGDNRFDDEGRVMIFETKDFFLVNVYVPNSKRDLERLNERLEFNQLFIKKCEELRKKKPIIFTGDLNVAHREVDLMNPKTNLRCAGFTVEERNAFSNQLEKGYIDTFRMFNDKPEQYTWWSYMRNARERNIGWRIDYFIVSKELKDQIKSSEILQKVMGSDHCPVLLEL